MNLMLTASFFAAQPHIFILESLCNTILSLINFGRRTWPNETAALRKELLPKQFPLNTVHTAYNPTHKFPADYFL